MMIHFNSDYTEGAHPLIIERLTETNLMQTAGYGEDEYCSRARSLIQKACKRDDLDIHFLVGGTQVNLTVISCALRPHQGVISAQSGHINVHETGAIEATGHKVITLPCSVGGKITAKQIDELCHAYKNDPTFEHTVQPKMVYISQPTENGDIYAMDELSEISDICKAHGLYLFADGARLGYALEASTSDITLSDMCDLCDVFYIGGTKIGALFGEAVVIINNKLKPDFRSIMKQKGAMLAKGRLLGIQFEVLFENGLYSDISKKANAQAAKISDACASSGFDFLCKSYTNQQFPIFPNEYVDALSNKYSFAIWEKIDLANSAVRFCTSWATTDRNVSELINDIKNLKG